MPAAFRLIAVELWTARIPRIARFAEHHWLVIHRPDACDRWEDEEAMPLAHRIETAPECYPWLDKYRVFPGPNSNTFVQWALGSRHTLGWRGVGRRFAKRAFSPGP